MDVSVAAGIPDDRISRVLRRRAAIATGLLLLCAVADFLAIAAEVGDSHLVSQLRSGAYVSLAAASTADSRVRDLGWVQLGLFVGTAAAFITWFSYAYGNLERLGIGGLRFGKGWAIGGWFVPVLWFVRPKQIANDIWRGSDPNAAANLNLSSEGDGAPWILNLWWGAFVLVGVFDRIAFFSNRNATTPSAISSSLKLLIASDAIDFVAALLAVAVVYQTTARQRARIARLRGAEAVEPASIRSWRIGAGASLAVGLIVAAMFIGIAVAPSSARLSSTSESSGVTAHLKAIALRPGDVFGLAGSPIRCSVERVRGFVAVACLDAGTTPSRSQLRRNYNVALASLGAWMYAGTTRLVRQVSEPNAQVVEVPQPTTALQKVRIPLGTVVPIGGSDVACGTERADGQPSVVCGILARTTFRNRRIIVSFVPSSYGILLNRTEAQLVKWKNAHVYVPVVSKRQPATR
jgi:hypothetical protein